MLPEIVSAGEEILKVNKNFNRTFDQWQFRFVLTAVSISILSRFYFMTFSTLSTTSNRCFCSVSLNYRVTLNPIRPGLFSRSPGPGGGSEARMAKIKVNINLLK